MKATRLLEQQHRDAEELFHRIASGDCDVSQVMDELGTSLLTHMLVEQVVLLPEVLSPDDKMGQRACDEHALARFELRRLLSESEEPSSRSLSATLAAVKALLDHHIREQEQELLPRAEAVLPAETNERLGEKMEQLFDVMVARSHRTDSFRFTPHDARTAQVRCARRA